MYFVIDKLICSLLDDRTFDCIKAANKIDAEKYIMNENRSDYNSLEYMFELIGNYSKGNCIDNCTFVIDFYAQSCDIPKENITLLTDDEMSNSCHFLVSAAISGDALYIVYDFIDMIVHDNEKREYVFGDWDLMNYTETPIEYPEILSSFEINLSSFKKSTYIIPLQLISNLA